MRSARRGGDGPRARRARCGQRVRSAQTAEEMQRRSKEKNQKANAARHDETHQTRRTPETARAPTAGRGGTGPPRCLDNCASNRLGPTGVSVWGECQSGVGLAPRQWRGGLTRVSVYGSECLG